MIINLYTEISLALDSLAVAKYYTVVPDAPVYPYLYIASITQDMRQHKDTVDVVDDHIHTHIVQIETRSKTQLEADTLRDELTQLIYESLNCKIQSSQAIIYDAETAVYRGITDFEIML